MGAGASRRRPPHCVPAAWFRNPRRQNAACRAGSLQELRDCLTASCIPIPASHGVKKWLVTSCFWGRQRCLSSPYLFNSELEENHHSEVEYRNACGMCRTSSGVIASQEKWLVELCIIKSFHILINRLHNKTLHFILASFLNAKESLTLF